MIKTRQKILPSALLSALSMVTALPSFAQSTSAESNSKNTVVENPVVEDKDAFAFYQENDYRPLSTIIALDYVGFIEVNYFNVNEDSEVFGQYNGLNEEGSTGSISGFYRRWLAPESMFDYVQFSAKDLGLKSGELSLALGELDHYKFAFNFNQIQQIKSMSGSTPYIDNGNYLALPNTWVSGLITSDMTELKNLSTPFEQSLERNHLDLSYQQELGEEWTLTTVFSQQDKKGTMATGGALYANASNGHSAILPETIDHSTQNIELGIAYQEPDYFIQTSYLYSRFKNAQDSLAWQTPYSAFLGAGTSHPDGFGQLSVAPDNTFYQLRASGKYIFSRKWRLSGDISYASASQDDDFLPYTINTNLSSPANPTNNLGIEVTTITAKTKLSYRATSKLNFEAFYHYKDRQNNTDRQAFQSVFGDVWAPLDTKYAVYNAPKSNSRNNITLKASYRLPLASKVSFIYDYEEINRYNHAVDTTEENSFTVKLRSRPLDFWQTRVELAFKDRASSEYQWDRSYYSLFDRQLINETPDNQRYTNHPLLSQFYLANREQGLAKINISYSPMTTSFLGTWQASFDLLYQENDYDKTTLGITQNDLLHGTLAGMWNYSKALNFSLYVSFDDITTEQAGREFTGGIEKSAFELYAPLPQASDPSRNWTISPNDQTLSIGMSADWSVIEKTFDLNFDFRLSDSTSSNDNFTSGGASDLTNIPLPDVMGKEQFVSLGALYHMSEQITFKASYQYFKYDSDNWAFNNSYNNNSGVSNTTLDKVLATGQSSPNEQVHIIQLSLVYRFK
jgi:MtrB/PioB family decaheme-associated outer membrane protein